jgi:hypothetical protein
MRSIRRKTERDLEKIDPGYAQLQAQLTRAFEEGRIFIYPQPMSYQPQPVYPQQLVYVPLSPFL